MLKRYSGLSTCGSALLMVDWTKKNIYCWIQNSNESLNSSISREEGIPYFFNRLGGTTEETDNHTGWRKQKRNTKHCTLAVKTQVRDKQQGQTVTETAQNDYGYKHVGV
jgi:hypothetical protein